MKKALFLLLAGLMSFGVAIKASADARLDALGTDVREVEDIDSIWLYANKILDYKDTADFSLNADGNSTGVNGGGVNEWGGVIHDMGDDFGTVGIYVNRPAASPSMAGNLVAAPIAGQLSPLFSGITQQIGGAGNAFAPSNNLDLLWAKNIAGIGDAGLHLSYADNQASTPVISSQAFGLSLGLGLGQFLSFNQTNVHIGYAFDSLTDSTSATPLHDDGVYTISLGFLAQTDLNTKDTARVFGDIQYDNDNLPTNWSTGQQTANDTEILLGGSVKHNITDKGFVNTGLELEYDGGNSNTNTKYDAYTAIWNASVESALNSWLTARAGLEKAIYNRSYAATSPATWTDNSLVSSLNNNVSFNTGASINVENWTLDTQVSVASLDAAITNPQPGNGVFFGNGAGLLTITQADLRYKF